LFDGKQVFHGGGASFPGPVFGSVKGVQHVAHQAQTFACLGFSDV
jgi:hypothetical protein